MTNAVAIAQGGSNNVTFRNRIINGNMVIDQRNAGASTTPADSTYVVDRFVYYSTQASKFNAQQVSTAPTGFINSLKFTTASAVTVGASDYFMFSQAIEGLNITDLGWGTANAKTVTLSFQVYSSLTGTFGGSLTNSGQSRSYPFTYTISSANTWTTVSITVAGDTSGTWLTTNGQGIRVFWGLGVGSTNSGTAGAWAATQYFSATGAVSVVGTAAATMYITGVQLEAGTTASPFEYRQYGTELALCMRYCVNYNSANASSSYFRYGISENESTTTASQILQFPVPMRTGPTLTTTGTAANYAVYSAGAVVVCTAVPSIGTTSPLTAQIGWTTGAVLTAGRAGSLLSNNNNTSYLIFSAEL